MNGIRALLSDRRRAQRGSVLSGVLIITAFLAIIAGALMTELSTNFLLSRALVNRVGNEATVNSAVELALGSLQTTPLINGCPSLNSVSLNGRTASVAYASCAPVVDVRSPQFTRIASSSPFSMNATHSIIPGTYQDRYLIGDSGSKIYEYPFGGSAPSWSMDVGSSITGPPLAMQDAAASPPDTGDAGTGRNADISTLVPITGGGSSGCTASFCVELLGEDVPNPPDIFCYMAASARVTSRPAAGVAFPQIAYFGDSGGTLYAYNATEFSCSPSGGPAAQQARITTPGNAAIVAGPIVFANGAKDEIFIVTSTGLTSQLLRYTYLQGSPPSLTLANNLAVPFSNPVGLALERTSLPARVAITFRGGGVAVARIDATYTPSVLATTVLGTQIADAPSWCSCPSGLQIGIAGISARLYVLDPSLNPVASYATGSALYTAPAPDPAGDWFVGADNGNLYEIPAIQPTPTVLALGSGAFGQVRSSVQVAACPAGICAYLGSLNGSAYIVPLDARDAVVTACISTSPPACSGDNPRLWAHVQVGDGSSLRTVHVGGWSYYSP